MIISMSTIISSVTNPSPKVELNYYIYLYSHLVCSYVHNYKAMAITMHTKVAKGLINYLSRLL